jgi:hypothetical protein
MATIKNPKKGQFVFDKHYKSRRKVTGIANGLYYLGSEHEPTHRKEFTFPLPKKR